MTYMDRGQWRTIAIVAGTTAFASIIVSVGIIRLCVGSDAMVFFSIRSVICGGDLNAGRVGFKRLTAQNMSAISEIAESKEFSIDRNNDATALIDGEKNTLAAPANQNFDYVITLTEPHRIRQTIITWGDYGVNSNYIASWSLEASDDGKIWTTIKKGDSPNESETIVNEDFTAFKIRVKAQSPKDWIGIYEVEFIGRPL